VTVELVILAPLVGLLLGAVVLVGRVQASRADLEGAARAAARDLSIARDPQASTGEVRRDAEVSLEVGSPTCRSMTFTPTISATEVSVTIACVVDLQDAAVLPVPATMTLTADATEILDVHRETDTAFGIP
jgi:Flp pilus assembly protein TadG